MVASVDTVLAELETVLLNGSASGGVGPSDRVKGVIAGRTRVLGLIAALNDALASDPRLESSPELARLFRDRLITIRGQVASIQAKWRLNEVAENYDRYSLEMRPVAEAILDFVRWARQARAAA